MLGLRRPAIVVAPLSAVVGVAGSLLCVGTAQAAQVVVRRGDTLTSLAARYGTTPWALAHVNQLSDADHIEAGQTLSVPAAPPVAAVVPGTGAGTGRSITVGRGQTLTAIAAQNRVSISQLMAANGITNPDKVQAGTRLVIPGAALPRGLGTLGGPSAAFLASRTVSLPVLRCITAV